MYQPPTIFDFQRNLDTLIHSGEHRARAAAVNVKSDHAARGLSDSTTVITMAIGQFNEIHQDILQRAMQLIEDFCSRNAELAPRILAGTHEVALTISRHFCLRPCRRQVSRRRRNDFVDSTHSFFDSGWTGRCRISRLDLSDAARSRQPRPQPPISEAPTAIKLTDAVTLKPTFMGVGVDLRKAWNWFRDKWRAKRPHP
jgi:hypothetical protein